MDWFERLTGFRETREAVQSKLAVTGTRLTSLVNGKTYEIGELTLPRLADFRSQVPNFRSRHAPAHHPRRRSPAAYAARF